MNNSVRPSGIHKAISLHQQGNLEKADKSYTRILRSKPSHTEALHMRGVLKLEQGQYQLAENLLKKAHKTCKSDPWIKFHYAQLLVATDRHTLAIKWFEEVIDSGIEEADVFFMYGNSLFQSKRFSDAAANYEKALQIKTNDEQCRLNLANAYEALGDIPKAIECLQFLLTLNNPSVPIQLQYSELLLIAQQARKAHDTVVQIVSVTADEIDQLLSTAVHFQKRGRYDSVSHLLDLALKHTGVLGRQQVDLIVGLLNDTGRFTESRQLFVEAGSETECTAWSWFQQGLCHQVFGDFESAAECHRTALNLDNNLGVAAYSLACNGSTAVHGHLLNIWTRKIDESAIEEQHRAQFEFAVAREFDKLKHFDRAFASYLKANALIAKKMPFDVEQWDDYIDNIINTYDAAFFERFAHNSRRNVLSDEQSGTHLYFIVGMPRSGSTLLEQRLTQNKDVIGLGEHFALRCLHADIPEVTGFQKKSPFAALDLESKHIQQFRRRYLKSLPASNKSLMYVDKMLGNFTRLGVLACMFPHARILHSCRNPMATSVSCFTNAFSNGLRFTYDLYSMGRAWRSYERLMQHWHKVLPLKIMDVHYEKLVADPDGYQQQIHHFLGITNIAQAASASEVNLRTSFDTQSIGTASFWQVRQPVTTSSVDAWRRFDAHLARLHEGLEHK